MKTIFILIFTLIISPQLLKAQTDSTFCKLIIKGEPFYLLKQGIRLDFDKRLKNPVKWISFSPTFYVNYGKSGDAFTPNYNRMIGAGFDFDYKHFVKNSPDGSGFYLSPGIMGQFYDINLTQMVWTTTNENNSSVILPENKVYNEQIFKFGGNALIGYQGLFMPSFYLDVYIGIGIRYSIYQSPYKVVKFNESSVDPGYTGIMLAGGLRVGVGW